MCIDSHTLSKSILTRGIWPLAPQEISLSHCFRVAKRNFERERLPLCHWEAKLPVAGSVKWQGLNESQRPTDGQQSPNPGEEAGWCNKVQNSNIGQQLSWRNSAMEHANMSLLNFTSRRGHYVSLCRRSAYWRHTATNILNKLLSYRVTRTNKFAHIKKLFLIFRLPLLK